MLSQLFATSPDCIALYEADSGRLTLVNAAFSQLTGYAAEEVVGRTADELGLWHDPKDPCRLRAAIDGEGRIDAMPARIATRSGRLASVLISAAAVTMDRRDYVVVNARDVTATRADTARARGDLRARLDRHRPDPRPPLRPGQPALRGDLRLAGRRAARPAGLGGLDRRGRVRRDRPARRAAARRRAAVRDRARDEEAGRQPLLVPPARPGGRPRRARAKAARSGSPTT